MPLTVRPEVAGIPSYKPGKPAPAGPGGVSYKLSSNENPYPPLPGVLAAAHRACERMNRYPDLAGTELINALATSHGVDADDIAIGTGSVAVLYNLLQAFAGAGDDVIYAWRSFEAYPIAVQLSGARGVKVPLGPGATHDLQAFRRAITPATKVIMLCTPNNPTGPIIDHDQLEEFIEEVPDDVLVVLDEAYVEFVTAPNAVKFFELRQPNVATLRTFSKAYGLAGFRIGYCIADPMVAAAVRAAATPFGVSIPAQAAAVASLQAEDELFARVAELIKERTTLADGLRDLGFEIPDAQGNFVWIPARERTQSFADAFAAGGIMTRAFADGTDTAGLRITVGEPEANRLVLEIAAALA